MKNKKPYRKPEAKTTYDEKSLCVRFDAVTWAMLLQHAKNLNVTPSSFVRVAVAKYKAA
jgi:hypothetical protein